MMIILMGMCVVIATITTVRILLALRRYSYQPAELAEDSPTVSVCITARNERHALTQSLERILASSYERQEVLVLDDASDDDTSLVIKSFAHAGVRFIPGRSLPAGWLGRNHAYRTLANEASGDIVLFLDVDTLIRPHTIRQLVAYYMKHELLMLSVLPRRDDGLRLSALFGTLRHTWELVTATKATPPCTSGVWMIDRHTLLDVTENAPEFGQQMRIEHTIAHAARQQQKRYRYLIARRDLGVRYEKRWKSQVETAQRLYYPMFGGTPLRALVSIGWLAALVTPIAVVPYGAGAALWLGLVAIAINMVGSGVYTFMTRPALAASVKTILWPLLMVQEFILLLISVLRYATNTVSWKGRHIHAQPSNHSHLQLE